MVPPFFVSVPNDDPVTVPWRCSAPPDVTAIIPLFVQFCDWIYSVSPLETLIVPALVKLVGLI